MRRKEEPRRLTLIVTFLMRQQPEGGLPT